MLIIYDLITLFITTGITINAIKYVLKGCKNILILCEITIYIINIIPIGIGLFVDFSSKYPSNMVNVINAMNDANTQAIYDTSMIFVSWIIFRLGKRGYRRGYNCNILSTKISKWGKRILTTFSFMGMLSIVLSVFFAPNPSIYFTYSYFYTNSYSTTSAEYLYHGTVMSYIFPLTLVSILMYYYLRHNKKATKYLVAFFSFVLVWCHGKRSYFVLILLGILAIDLIKMNRKRDGWKLIFKSVIFIGLIILFYWFYKEMIGKMVTTTDNTNQVWLTYELYFSRMSETKTAIYAFIKGDSMLAYPGESFVFDFLAFIPRRYWGNKPILFTRYYTAYAHGYPYGMLWQGGNLLSNFLVEHIANFGILGIVTGILFLTFVAKITEKSKNLFVQLSGLLFCVLSCTSAFSGVVMYLYYLWVVFCIYEKVHKRVFLKRRY